MGRLGFAGLVAGMMIATAPAMASEQVVNGDFSAGATGFTTDYIASPPEADGPGNYWINTNAQNICGCFASMGDHTTGTGNMLILDGAANADSRVWQETIAVVANTDYTLSFWLANLGTSGPIPVISARIDGGEVLNTGLLPYAHGGWDGFSTVINSGASTSLVLSFVDTANTHSYNDFAFDDVSLNGPSPGGGVPEPAAWALMVGGFGLAGAALRRRRGVVAV